MFLAVGLLGGLISSTASTDESRTSGANHAPVALPRGTPQETVAAVGAAAPENVKPLWLPQTRSDWDSIVSGLRSGAGYGGKAIDGQLEEVPVIAPAELLPMEDVYDEMWGGVLAPIWALMHPTQSWRILLPVPPEKVAPADE